MKIEQAGQLFNAGSTPACPEVKDDDLAAQSPEVDGGAVVGEGEGRSGTLEALGVAAAVAGCERKRQSEHGEPAEPLTECQGGRRCAEVETAAHRGVTTISIIRSCEAHPRARAGIAGRR